MRNRRSNSTSKDSSAAAEQDDVQSFNTNHIGSDMPARASDDATHNDAEDAAVETASRPKPTSSNSESRPARITCPATKPRKDLASELFDDDEEASKQSAPLTDSNKAHNAAPTTANNDAKADPEVELIVPSRKRRRAASNDSQIESQPSSSSFTTAIEQEDALRPSATETASLQLRIRQLEHQLAQAKAKSEESTGIIGAQHAIFQELHGQCICHICLEPSFRPCVLAPCGHVFCIHCLRAWFTKPLASEASAPAHWSEPEIERYQRSRTLKRKKICPSCRTELACPPVEVYLVRDMLEKVDQGLKLSKDADNDSQRAESSTAILSVDDKVRLRGQDLPKGAKLWQDIFDQDGPRRIIFDEMDGVPRCGSCGAEIFDGTCSNPECSIEYDSNSDYEDLRRRGWDDVDDMDDFDSSQYSEDGVGGGGARRGRRNGALAERLREFEDRHGRSEALHRGHRLEVPDDFTGTVYIDSSDNEHILEEDDEMDDFIVRDDMGHDEGHHDDDRPNSFDQSESEEDMGDDDPRYMDDVDDVDDDFLPGPRRIGRASAIEISDDEQDDRETSVEYTGHRGRRGVMEDDGEDSEDDEVVVDDSSQGSGGHSGSEDEEDDGYGGHLGSSTDSSARRRRARIVDDEDDEEDY